MPYPVLLFFDISGGELFVILLVAFVVFGPSKIPEVARKIGRGLNEVRRASDEIKREITKETKKMETEYDLDELDLTSTKKNIKKPKQEPLADGSETDKPKKPESTEEDKPASTE